MMKKQSKKKIWIRKRSSSRNIYLKLPEKQAVVVEVEDLVEDVAYEDEHVEDEEEQEY